METKNIFQRPLYAGIAGAAVLLVFYFTIVTAAQSFSHAVDQLKSLWYWVALLAAGLGIQVGLHTYINNAKCSTTGLAVGGGVSATSMVACCAHHITDFVPFWGLSAAVVLLAKYQAFFMVIGVLSNAIGIIYLLSIIQKNGLEDGHELLKKISGYDMQAALKMSLVLSAAIAVVAYLNA